MQVTGAPIQCVRLF